MSSDFGTAPHPDVFLTPDTAQLRLLNGPASGRCFPLNRLQMAVGRHDPPAVKVDIDLTGCELGTPPSVSRRHAEFQWVEGKLQVVDLCSTNGTFVNGEFLICQAAKQPSAPVTLEVGSKVKLGNLEFEVIVH
ncbi:FHA domain-containing protein [Kamptonema formosum]|jgi:pSer/pThr/pTyr-binding forkhead associated (FHA) protein|uniref:FHA domain-containing protein n=1 Tax=Kamptonema formosum TaxID=331992 RepID=UPI000346FDD1|nr:FHA domain-containing protein [Oscillatoria sp. PCC 10802]